MKLFIEQIGIMLLKFLLFLVAIFLVVLLSPWGIIEYVIKRIWKRKFIKALGFIGDLILTLAISVDMIGNVILQEPLNRIYREPNGYKFGNRFDTVSFVLGVNEKFGTLSKHGVRLSKRLSWFEKDHAKVTVEAKIKHYKGQLKYLREI